MKFFFTTNGQLFGRLLGSNQIRIISVIYKILENTKKKPQMIQD